MESLEEVGDEKPKQEDRLPTTAGPAVTLRGDLWQLGNNCVRRRPRPVRSRATDAGRAGGDDLRRPALRNTPVDGHVQGRGRNKHAEFAFASGEIVRRQRLWTDLTV